MLVISIPAGEDFKTIWWEKPANSHYRQRRKGREKLSMQAYGMEEIVTDHIWYQSLFVFLVENICDGRRFQFHILDCSFRSDRQYEKSYPNRRINPIGPPFLNSIDPYDRRKYSPFSTTYVFPTPNYYSGMFRAGYGGYGTNRYDDGYYPTFTANPFFIANPFSKKL